MGSTTVKFKVDIDAMCHHLYQVYMDTLVINIYFCSLSIMKIKCSLNKPHINDTDNSF